LLRKNRKIEVIPKLGEVKIVIFFTKTIVRLDIKVLLQYGCEQPHLEVSSH